MLQIKMTYCEPPQIVWCKDEFGRDVRGRAPKSPTRSARAYEVETWWEDVLRPELDGPFWNPGAIVRHWPPQVGSNGKANHV